MEFTYKRIDVPMYEGQKDPPHDVIQRQSGEIWLVPHAPVSLDQPVAWQHHKREDYVYVPLHPYLLPTSPDLALGFMLQLGIKLASELGQPLRRLHLAIGHPVNEISQQGVGNAWQYQVGLALRIK
jgi:hypothetical protein